MKDFRISVYLGVTDLIAPASDVDVLEEQLEGHLSHFTPRFGGWGVSGSLTSTISASRFA